MRPFTELSNAEKAKYLHQFFPNAMPSLISWIEYIANDILKNQEEATNDWKHKTISAEQWIKLAERTIAIIKEHRAQLAADSDFFAIHLFPAFMGIFSLYCIQHYINICPNQSLLDAVKFFFALKPERQIQDDK